jgi:aspartate kinase
MTTVVMKFGGTSVANVERIRNVAQHVKREVEAGNRVAVVVSAMAGVTNQLVGWVRETALLHDAREYDAIVGSGENVTAGLLAIALQSVGIQARSWQGWQIPILTDAAHGAARIIDIPGEKLRERLASGEVAVVTGFQGVEPNRTRIATLGRGGSDTSAVALAVALQADLCDIYTDVDGIYTTDPRVVPKARRLSRISYEEMLEMASLGSKVLQTRSVELAMVHRMRTRVLSSFTPPDEIPAAHPDSWHETGTIVCDEDEIVEQQVVSGIAFSRDEAKITLRKIADRPHHHARPRRLGHERSRAGRRAACRPLRYLHRCGRRLYDRSARGAQGAPARAHFLRGDARNGLARLQGAPDAVGRTRHGPPDAHAGAVELHPARRDSSRPPRHLA